MNNSIYAFRVIFLWSTVIKKAGEGISYVCQYHVNLHKKSILKINSDILIMKEYIYKVTCMFNVTLCYNFLCDKFSLRSVAVTEISYWSTLKLRRVGRDKWNFRRECCHGNTWEKERSWIKGSKYVFVMKQVHFIEKWIYIFFWISTNPSSECVIPRLKMGGNS